MAEQNFPYLLIGGPPVSIIPSEAKTGNSLLTQGPMCRCKNAENQAALEPPLLQGVRLLVHRGINMPGQWGGVTLHAQHQGVGRSQEVKPNVAAGWLQWPVAPVAAAATTSKGLLQPFFPSMAGGREGAGH